MKLVAGFGYPRIPYARFPSPAPGERWAFWSRFIWCNRYADAPRATYAKLLRLLEGTDYFAITTNVDHQFQKAGFAKERLFYTQGDYGLWQCSVPCHGETYDNYEAVRLMVESQGISIGEGGKLALPRDGALSMEVPASLVPACPVCGKPQAMSLRADDTFVAAQDELLRGLIAEAGVHDPGEAVPSPDDPRLCVWRGDITTLSADAIVNAANSQMLGCWAPLHYCIDNAIHTFAGVQLRIACARLMAAQGHDEPTGRAKVTSAYNLPAGRVIHTVGPIADGHPTDEHRAQLASCYENCLAAAAAEHLRSVAFCCISTGVFGFPQREAAGIAVRTVRNWLDAADAGNEGLRVVFNVFSEVDEAIYQELLGL